MTRRDLDNLTLQCRYNHVMFQIKKKIDGNYSIVLHEERRTAVCEYNTYQLAKDKLEEILFLRKNPPKGRYRFFGI